MTELLRMKGTRDQVAAELWERYVGEVDAGEFLAHYSSVPEAVKDILSVFPDVWNCQPPRIVWNGNTYNFERFMYWYFESAES